MSEWNWLTYEPEDGVYEITYDGPDIEIKKVDGEIVEPIIEVKRPRDS